MKANRIVGWVICGLFISIFVAAFFRATYETGYRDGQINAMNGQVDFSAEIMVDTIYVLREATPVCDTGRLIFIAPNGDSGNWGGRIEQ